MFAPPDAASVPAWGQRYFPGAGTAEGAEIVLIDWCDAAAAPHSSSGAAERR